MKSAEELAEIVVAIFEIIQNLTPIEALQVATVVLTNVSGAIIQKRTIEDVFENGLPDKKKIKE